VRKGGCLANAKEPAGGRFYFPRLEPVQVTRVRSSDWRTIPPFRFTIGGPCERGAKFLPFDTLILKHRAGFLDNLRGDAYRNFTFV
jgi:hypothetical protein